MDLSSAQLIGRQNGPTAGGKDLQLPRVTNAVFNCKVLSRQHAIIWHEERGKFFIKDLNR